MAMLLPRGIVENTQEIYAEVASYPVVPPEKICEYWNVYTTTFRRLLDPTAYRLENFWWHVWGSDRRHLSGPALAKLFEEFSNGQTFVPLKSTGNRYEGPSIPRARRQKKPDQGDSKTPRQPVQKQDQSPSPPKTNTKPPTPSSSRPAPPHPILKKSRGPSASGARPTARFASPPASDDGNDGGKSDDVSSRSTVVSSSEMPPPPLPVSVGRERIAASKPTAPRAEMPPPPVPVSKKDAKTTKSGETGMRPPSNQSPGRSEKGAAPTRRIVAATAASKRRPSMPRRQTSQSSASSDASSSSNISRQFGSQRQSSSIVEQPDRSSQGSSGSSSQASLLLMGSKAAGKRPAKSASKRSNPRNVSAQGDSAQEQTMTGRYDINTPPQRRSTWDLRDTAVSSPAAQSPRPPVAGFVSDQRIENFSPRVERSISLVEAPKRSREGSVGGAVAQALVSTSVVATTHTTAQGRFDSETITPPSIHPEARDIPDSLSLPHRSSYAAPLDGQFTPTPPNPAPPVPFGRSKSQLTLILEREKSNRN